MQNKNKSNIMIENKTRQQTEKQKQNNILKQEANKKKQKTRTRN